MEPEKVPDPSNDKAMAELHDFVSKWTERHGLQGAKELYYLALYLAGRQNVQVKLENLKRLYADEDKPFNIAERCEELIAHYEANYCECWLPPSRSPDSNRCNTCGKPIRNE